jgi:hypothetical protein
MCLVGSAPGGRQNLDNRGVLPLHIPHEEYFLARDRHLLPPETEIQAVPGPRDAQAGGDVEGHQAEDTGEPSKQNDLESIL